MNDKELKIYNILYDLYVDDTDCTKCQSFTYCMMHTADCLYHEDFELNDDDKDFLTKKALEIYETNDVWHLHIDDEKCQTTIAILINSVHELQNAYFIATKKELEIKL